MEETFSSPAVRQLFIVGVLAHLVGLLLYDLFPYLYFLSVYCLCHCYYLFLKSKGYAPLRTAAFWGMTFVLALPVVGVVAGYQKLRITPQRGEGTKRKSQVTTSLISLLLFVPLLVFYAALVLPTFAEAPPITMPLILLVAALVEIGLIVALVKVKQKEGPGR